MKSNKRYFQIAAKLAAWLTECVTEKELQELEKWKQEDVRHANLIEKLRQEEDFEENQQLLEHFPIDEGWNRIQRKLLFKERKKSVMWWKYAAVIFLVLGSGFLYLHVRRVVPIETTTFSQTISSGKQAARLTLGSGRVIEVLPGDHFTLSETDGTVIRKDSAGIDYQQMNANKDTLVYNQMETLTGMEYTFTLSDGTQVFLNAESVLKYPVAFRENVREVELSGEAYFKVAKDTAHPFIVKMGGVHLQVLGTSFNARSYTNEDQIVTTLIEGRVKINNRYIIPGEQAVYDKQTGQLKVEQVDVNQYIAWKNGRFVFRNERLAEVMKTLSRWYGVEYHFLDDAAKEVRIGASLGRYNDMTPIVDMLKHTDLIEILQTNCSIYISAKKIKTMPRPSAKLPGHRFK